MTPLDATFLLTKSSAAEAKMIATSMGSIHEYVSNTEAEGMFTMPRIDAAPALP